MKPRQFIVAAVMISVGLMLGGCAEDEEHFADQHWDDVDKVRGGLLYDKWWKINGETEPTSDFPLWSSQSTNERTGSTTWRCKECHGWDYIGKDGRYSSGSHYTGFEGVWQARNDDRTEIFDAIRNKGGDHDFSEVLDNHDVLDLAAFIIDGLIDVMLYIDEDGVAIGDTANGKTLYTENCQTCHGADGKQITTFDGVGYLALDNPQETLHKIRFGHPGSQMPSMVEEGKTAQEAADILSYAQKLGHFANEHWAEADLIRGGLMYDKWWKVNEETEPTSDFPLWSSQSTNERTGSTTWRCKECHGWDYIGKDGRYSSGSHYTGFEGVWQARNDDRTELFDAIKSEGGDHDFSDVLDDEDVLDLTKFVSDGLMDVTLYIDENGVAIGDTVNGETLYTENCQACHGADGKQITTFDGVGYLANDNPQETLHKIRFGHPGSQMPSMVEEGKMDQETADILSYAQTLPE